MKRLILEIELIPRSSWFSNVRSSVSKKQWDFIKKEVSTKAWDTCEICGDIGPKHPVECHEIWHYDDKKLIQKLSGMIALCPNCHMVKHFGLAQIQGRKENAIKHFMKINSINRKDAEKYIIDAFKIWDERSKKKWTLDIDILEEYGINVKKD